METKFKKGDVVSFERNKLIKSESTIVVGIVEPVNDNVSLKYIIEYIDGWNPDTLRIKKYDLLEDKKYLFVSEDELTQIIIE